MWKSDWLSHCSLSAISVQWLELVYEMAKVFLFAKALDVKCWWKWIIKILRRLNEGRLRFLDLKKTLQLSIKWCARVHNFNFKWQFNRDDLFKERSLTLDVLLFEVNFSRNSTKTIRLLALNFYGRINYHLIEISSS